MATSKNNKVKARRIISIILVVIGGITVADNVIRLSKEMVSTVTHHRWNMVVIK